MEININKVTGHCQNPEPCQTTKIERLAKTVNSQKPLTIFAKLSSIIHKVLHTPLGLNL